MIFARRQGVDAALTYAKSGKLQFRVEDYMLSQLVKALSSRLSDAVSVLDYMDQHKYKPHAPIYVILKYEMPVVSIHLNMENVIATTGGKI